MSRIKHTEKNVIFGYLSNILTILMGIVSRTVFIYTLGEVFLGINTLFFEVLNVLSFAEMGFGLAMNFSLYKPVATKDIEKIKSLMRFFRNAYRVIALVFLVLGLALLPFLGNIMKGTQGVEHIPLYYLIFLFNTVVSYFVSYKTSLAAADQKNYICTNLNTIFNILIVIAQTTVLLLFHSYLFYLIAIMIVGFFQKIALNWYLNRCYPYLKDKNVQKVEKTEIGKIKKNVIALVFHRLGDICVNQTDNIIISTFLSVTVVGLMSNYNLIITSISGFISILFNSAIGSLGNLVATEDVERQHEVFSVYRFISFWLYGFSATAFLVLLTPLITLWLGESMTASALVILLILVDYYVKGERYCLSNLKCAGGVFDQDKFVSVLQAVSNLVFSILLVNIIGLPGVYIGTIIQGLIAMSIRPVIVYREMFSRSSKAYYLKGFKYLLTVAASGALCYSIRVLVMSGGVSIWNFVLMTMITVLISNGIFWLFFHHTKEYLYVRQIVVSRLQSLLKRKS